MRRVYKNLCPATISASIMAANMWKNSLKNVESDNSKILYGTLLNFFFYSEMVLTFSIILIELFKPASLMQTSGPAIGVISIIIVGTISEFATITKLVIIDTKSCSEKFANASNYGTFAIFLSSVTILKIMGLRYPLMAYCLFQIL